MYRFKITTLSIMIGMILLSCTEQNIPLNPKSNDVIPFAESSEVATSKNVHRQISDVVSFADLSVIVEDGARLLRTHNNIQMNINTVELTPHDTYTVWWVVFNNPDACEDGCSEPDLFNDEVGGSVLYAAGHVIGATDKGNFAGSLRAGDLSGCQPPWDAFDLTLIGGEGEMDLCRDGLVDPEGSEVHLVVRTHGEKVPGMVNDQINTYAGACTAESSFGAGNGPNECEDQQAVVFLSPEAE